MLAYYNSYSLLFIWCRNQLKFGISFNAETSLIFTFVYGRNLETWFRRNVGYGRSYGETEAVIMLATQ